MILYVFYGLGSEGYGITSPDGILTATAVYSFSFSHV